MGKVFFSFSFKNGFCDIVENEFILERCKIQSDHTPTHTHTKSHISLIGSTGNYDKKGILRTPQQNTCRDHFCNMMVMHNPHYDALAHRLFVIAIL